MIQAENTYKNVRFLTMNMACEYYSMGRNSIYKYGGKWGALHKVGRKLLIDRCVMDAAIERQNTGNSGNNKSDSNRLEAIWINKGRQESPERVNL